MIKDILNPLSLHPLLSQSLNFYILKHNGEYVYRIHNKGEVTRFFIKCKHGSDKELYFPIPKGGGIGEVFDTIQQ